MKAEAVVSVKRWLSPAKLHGFAHQNTATLSQLAQDKIQRLLFVFGTNSISSILNTLFVELLPNDHTLTLFLNYDLLTT
jgi:hypothetical protein